MENVSSKSNLPRPSLGDKENVQPQHGLSGGPPFTQIMAAEPAGPPVTTPLPGYSEAAKSWQASS